MNIGKFSKKQVIIFAILVIIAVMGVISLASTSGVTKKATSRDTEADASSNINQQVTALTTRQDVIPEDQLEITNNLSKVVLRVDNMSCSGCIYTIKSGLSGIKGVQDILVNVSAGQTEVYYDTG